MQAPKAFNPTAIATFQFPGRVNRKRVIATCERGEWRGYVRTEDNGNLSDSLPELHSLWVAKARELAEGEPVPPVMLPILTVAKTIASPPLCERHTEHEVIAKVCRNETFQLRLRCDICDRQTPGAIKWEHFNSDVVIRAIARALQTESVTEPPLFEELRGVDSWV